MVHINTASIQAHDHRIRNSAAKVGRFSLHLLEMLLAMMAGMPILPMLRNLIPASSIYAAAFKSGTNVYGLTMAVFMTVPMVAWMIVRGHGWRHSAEMAFAMFVPLIAIIVLRLLGADAYLPWLDKASHLAMPLAMIIAMLYRRDHYTGKAGHSAHATHRSLH
jgi:flagellar biosynthetic protein FliP